ncbi:MAG: hypothetical protein COC24_014845 [Alphaproteobacteria bacterium]|nr:hypothetical protein [Alphaproteobacteria bacterium]
MAYSFLIFALRGIPKWLLVGLAGCFFCYYLGISHGRAPYKLAVKIQDARARVIVKRADKIRDMIEQKGRLADEVFSDNECLLDGLDAQRLSDIVGR